MDIKTLLDNLHDEVSCSVCKCAFTDPKQLPCLHSFCLHCLNGIQRTSGVHGKITCPECRRQFQIPGKCNTTNVKCGNCDKRSTQTLYCFRCCSFWCEECILGHNMIRINKEHRTLAVKDFQDQDIEAVLKRPAFCQKKRHEKEELKFFCKDCEVAICNTCAVTLHEGHGKMLLEEAAEACKTQIKSITQSLKEKAQEKRKELEQLNQKSEEIKLQAAYLKSQVQTNVDQVIAIIEAWKQDVFNAVDFQAKSITGISLTEKRPTVLSETKIQQLGAKGKESSKVIVRNKKGQMFLTVLLRLRYKPGVSDLCCHLDKKVSLLECLQGPVVWQ
ncbi:unnamed protein product [Porites evermanni]|uniref:Uncharacterized protein n=1 Tax=Porites evermanni TaxID=104178 RepID=A0ABN8MKY9_9CNID|nr:unnamed protein product [Porites evermanni]